MKTLHALGCFVAGMIMMGLIHHRQTTGKRHVSSLREWISDNGDVVILNTNGGFGGTLRMSWTNTCFANVTLEALGKCVVSNHRGPIYTNDSKGFTSHYNIPPGGGFELNGHKIIAIQMEEF